MPDSVQRLNEADWAILLDKLKRKMCTPFLGPEVSANAFDQRGDIAQNLIASWGAPDEQWEYLDDPRDLARVGRFLSVKYSADFARSRLFEEYGKLPAPNFNDPKDPYVALASLPIPIFVTTNHTNFMMQALIQNDKEPHAEICRWKKNMSDTSTFLTEGNEPTAARPVVFHFYGYPQTVDRNTELESLAFTEDDYFEFLINVSGDDDAIPLRIRRAMAGTSLLLLGYRVEEWDFRVLFHYLLAKQLQLSNDRTHIAVQVPLDEARPAEQRKKVQEFLNRYIASKRLDIRIYWGTTHEFVDDLKSRWSKLEK